MLGPRGLGALLVLLTAQWAMTARASSEDEALNAVRALVAEGSRAEARALLDSLVVASDSLTVALRGEALYLRTVLEEDGSAFGERLRLLLEETAATDRRAWIYLSLGRVAFSEGNLTQALKDFRKAQKEGAVEEGSLWEGLTAFALGDGPAARSALERVRESGNRAIRQRALVVLGDTYRAAGAWEEASTLYRRVREKESPEPGWWATAVLREAQCLEALSDPGRAASLLRELATRAPGSYEAPLARQRLAALEQAEQAEEGTADGEGAPGPEPTPEGPRFTVQVGAFGSEDNAETLAAQVRQAGFSDTRVIRGRDNLHRVLVGRFTARSGAESMADSLSIELGLGFSIVEEP
jgi:tetratricopeptide (TPR) repeat protein